MKNLHILIIAILFTTNIFAQTDSITDIDGNTYGIVEIGTQVWMSEDLRVTHYPNGDPIPNVTIISEWAALADNDSTDAYSFYNNNSNTEYGALYSFAAAIADNWERDNLDGQGVCPNGWHLPTDTEWTELVNYLGGTSIAGGKLKEISTTHWLTPNTGATNESGFTALPTGYRDYSCGAFGYIGTYGAWWTANEYTAYPTRAFKYMLNNSGENINRSFNQKSYGFCVRCIKNSFTVIFQDWDGTGIDTVKVAEGYSANPPSNPTRDGYVFTNWDTDFSNITNDLIVTAQYNIVSSIKNTENKSINIYPNPVTDILYINSDNTINKIEIFDLTGT